MTDLAVLPLSESDHHRGCCGFVVGEMVVDAASVSRSSQTPGPWLPAWAFLSGVEPSGSGLG